MKFEDVLRRGAENQEASNASWAILYRNCGACEYAVDPSKGSSEIIECHWHTKQKCPDWAKAPHYVNRHNSCEAWEPDAWYRGSGYLKYLTSSGT